jgi:predicted RNase H-like nuclease (RuvC/YqgF family)
MEEDGRKDQSIDNITGKPFHECVRKEEWGKTIKTHEDHERRITFLEKKTDDNTKDISELNTQSYKLFSSLKEELDNGFAKLRSDLKITKLVNGQQNKDIKGIQQEEKEKIQNKARNKWAIIGIVVGAIVGVVGTFFGTLIIELIKYYTTLL